MRGLPGSGKSTKARSLQRDYQLEGIRCVVCSTDNIQESCNGKYLFELEMLGTYHRACQKLAELCCKAQVPYIIIDNTNIRKRDYKFYLQVASSYNYDVEEIIVGESQPDEETLQLYASRNQHEVPIDVIRSMAQKFNTQ